MARSRVELSGQIRRDWRAGGSSIRELAVRHRVRRRTVRQAVASAVPPPRKEYPPRARPAIGRYAAVIDGWLLAGRAVPGKQRHTARRIWQRLVAEHGAGVAEVTVWRYVRCRAGSGTTTCGPRWCGCCAAGTGPNRNGSSRCAAITGPAPFFCILGSRGAHEKGGVEGEIGRFRRRLVPVPAVASMAALNQLIAAADMVDDGRVITGRPVTIAAAFAAEQPAMGPLSAEPSGPGAAAAGRVDARAGVCVRQNYYSVPARYAGRRLPVRLPA